MVLKEDLKNKFTKQLTIWRAGVKGLEYALKQFRDDPARDCIVKVDKKTGRKEVFVEE